MNTQQPERRFPPNDGGDAVRIGNGFRIGTKSDIQEGFYCSRLSWPRDCE
jgi:hypothetical protein